MVSKVGQFPGATFTGKMHWRIYPKNRTFNFLSNGRLEQTVKTLSGVYVTEGPYNVHDVTLPTGLNEKHFIRGTTQIEGRSANIIGGTGGTAWYVIDNNTIRLQFVTYPEVLPVGTKIFYTIQLVPITPQETFVFNSQKYSFAFPKTVTQNINTAPTIAANATVKFYGSWIQIPGTKTAYDVVIKWSGEPTISYLHYAEMQFQSGSVSGTTSIETSGTTIRPVLTVTNYTGSPVTYPTRTVTYGVNFYQTNNTN